MCLDGEPGQISIACGALRSENRKAPETGNSPVFGAILSKKQDERSKGVPLKVFFYDQADVAGSFFRAS